MLQNVKLKTLMTTTLMYNSDKNTLFDIPCENIAWCAIFLLILIAATWYIIYAIKVIKPNRKISAFAQSPEKDLDWDLFRICVFGLAFLSLAIFSFCLAIYYVATDKWLIPSFTWGLKVAIVVGAGYLLLNALKNSTSSLHGHFKDKDKMTPVKDKKGSDNPAKKDNQKEVDTSKK